MGGEIRFESAYSFVVTTGEEHTIYKIYVSIDKVQEYTFIDYALMAAKLVIRKVMHVGKSDNIILVPHRVDQADLDSVTLDVAVLTACGKQIARISMNITMYEERVAIEATVDVTPRW